MTMDQTALRDQSFTRLTVTEHTGSETLQECVRQALRHYFAQLGDHHPTDVYAMVMSEVEQPLLETAMKHVGGNQTRAASMLGISRGTLRKKLGKYGIA